MRGMHYFVLTIFTRGAIADVKETIKSLNASYSFPISVIFVGIGSHDFSELKKLVADVKNQPIMNGNGNGHDENGSGIPVQVLHI